MNYFNAKYKQLLNHSMSNASFRHWEKWVYVCVCPNKRKKKDSECVLKEALNIKGFKLKQKNK